MPIKPQSISTAADELFELVKKEKEISFKDAAQKFKVPVSTIEAWATFLEEDNMLAIKYKLTTPYLAFPLPQKSKKKSGTGLGKEKLFLYKTGEAEAEEEFEKADELLDRAERRRTEGEFGMLGGIESQILAMLKSIVGFLVSKAELSPQAKADLADELAEIEKKIAQAAELAMKNKFDEANRAHSEISSSFRQLLEKARQGYEAKPESLETGEEGIKKLL